MIRKCLDGLYLFAGLRGPGGFLVLIFAIMMVMSVGAGKFRAQTFRPATISPRGAWPRSRSSVSPHTFQGAAT